MKKLFILAFLLLIGGGVAQAQQNQALSAAATTCTATGTSCLIVGVDPQSGGATFTVTANASANTIQFEASGDNAKSWVALNATPSNSTTAATSTTSTGTWQANVAGYTLVRMRMSTLVGGTTTVSIIQSIASARAGGGGGGSSGLSGMTAGQVPIAATATTVTSSEALAGSGAAITTGPASSTSTDFAAFTGTGGQIADSGIPDTAVGQVPYGTGAGSVNVMTVTTSPAVATNAAGTIVAVLPNLANTTTTPTLNVGGAGAQTITKFGTGTLTNNDYVTTAIAYFVSDGTHWQLINPQEVVTVNNATLSSNNLIIGQGGRVVLNTGVCSIAGAGTNLACALYASSTKCAAVGSAASPSVAACAASPAGVFSCATNAVNTCTVNTTAMISANSTVIVTQDDSTTTGTLLGVTCNTTASSVNPSLVTAKVAATSFSIGLTQPVTNPDCFQYFIIN